MSLVLDLIFPNSCYQCHSSSQYLCHSCQQKLIYRSIKYTPNSPLDGHLSLFRYHQAIKDMIKDLKFNFVSDLVDTLATISANGLKSHYPRLLLLADFLVCSSARASSLLPSKLARLQPIRLAWSPNCFITKFVLP